MPSHCLPVLDCLSVLECFLLSGCSDLRPSDRVSGANRLPLRIDFLHVLVQQDRSPSTREFGCWSYQMAFFLSLLQLLFLSASDRDQKLCLLAQRALPQLRHRHFVTGGLFAPA